MKHFLAEKEPSLVERALEQRRANWRAVDKRRAEDRLEAHAKARAAKGKG